MKAFAKIYDPQRKKNYDVLSSAHLDLPVTIEHIEYDIEETIETIGPEAQITAIPSYYNPFPSVLPRPRDPDARIVQYPWRYYFADLHYAPNIAFQQILPDKFCRKRVNSFWLSLSLALTGTDKFCESDVLLIWGIGTLKTI